MRDFKGAAQEETTGRWMRIRFTLVGAVFLALFAAALVRAFQLQVEQQPRLREMARDQYVREIEIPARRGEIVDRRGVGLAQSVDIDSIWIDPSMLTDERVAARVLAKATGVDATELYARLQKGKRFAWVKRQATPDEVAAVQALGVPGLGFTKEPRRFYPQREIGAHLLGLVGTEGKGLDGVELAFEDELSGDPSRRSSLRDARGRKLVTTTLANSASTAGARVTLTIDRQLQFLADRALTRAVTEAKATAGMAVVLEPSTGEILALANAPSFNPNAPQAASADGRRNRAVTDIFEPGSTFKAFVVASALDHHVINETTEIDCQKGAWTIGKHTINDTHPHELLTPEKILQFSSNIGAAKIGARLGPERLQRTYQAFGFGERSGLGLPSEGKGVVNLPRGEIALATMSFGQGISATALQIAAAFGALGNDGVLMRPTLIKSVVDADGSVLLENRPTKVRAVVSPAAARKVVSMLESVVTKEGTAPRARLPDYRVAGKTGTAQKPDPVSRGYSDKRIASFVGLVPAQDPKLVILVVIDEPQTDVYGGLVAAPAFKEIAAAALPYLGVAPDAPVASPAPAVAAEARPKSGGARVAPIAGAPSGPQPTVDSVRVPSLEGLTARAAVAELSKSSLDVRMTGSGFVKSQTPGPGSWVDRGSRVVVELWSATSEGH